MQIELLKREPDDSLTEVQAETFRLLLALAEEGQRYTAQEIARRCNLSSPLAYWSRLRRLEAKGLIRITDHAAATLPISSLLKA